jgi:hypothetical protein
MLKAMRNANVRIRRCQDAICRARGWAHAALCSANMATSRGLSMSLDAGRGSNIQIVSVGLVFLVNHCAIGHIGAM